RLERDANQFVSRLNFPYGRLFPIQRALLNHNPRGALTLCERAILDNEQAGNQTAAQAFAALFLQLSHRSGRGATADHRVRELASAAVRSSATRYQCSHLFVEAEVRALLADGPETALRHTAIARRRRRK